MSNKMTNKKLTSFSDHLDSQYGKKGTEKREQYEEEFEAFKLGVMIQELRKSKAWHKNNLPKNVVRQKRIFPELRTTQATLDFLH